MDTFEHITVIIPNKNGSIRWYLNIKEISGGNFKVEEKTKYPLFNSDNWESGKTPGEALDNFLKVESDLINNM